MRLEIMYETFSQDSITSTSMQTYDGMETIELSIVNENKTEVV